MSTFRPSKSGMSISPVALGAVGPGGARDGFVADSVLAEWLRVGLATRDGGPDGGILHVKDGATFVLVDGVRVLGRRDGESDPYSLTGRVLTLRSILRRGGMISADGLRLGSAIYDVAFGVLLTPLEAQRPATSAADDGPPTERRPERSVG